LRAAVRGGTVGAEVICLTTGLARSRRRRTPCALALLALAALFAALALPANAAFPGTNGKFVVGAGGDLYTFNPDGSELANITNSGGTLQARSPSWSPDARKIAFSAKTPGFEAWEEIFVINADGTGLTNLTNSPEVFEFEPAWSADGSKIAFVSNLDLASLQIYAMNPDGSGQTNLSSNNYSFNTNPAWSPDETRIAFDTQREQDNFANAIWVMNADGSNQTDVTHNADYNGYLEPDWAPDSSKILFAASGSPAMPLQTINPDGTGLAQVPGTVGARFPIWSPDGQRVAYPGGGGIVTVKLDGTDPTAPVGVEGTFDWAPVPSNRPPDCSAVTADPAVLSPAHGLLRLVALSGATDPDGDVVSTSITAVTQDEPLTSPGDTTTPDAVAGDSPDQVYLRAESSRRGDGRVYRIDFEVSDGQATCTGRATVQVPRRRDTTAIDSAPPSYDSFGA